MQVMAAVVQLDIINARALHATWLSGLRPQFNRPGSSKGSVSLPGARHPLLLARSLPPLPAVVDHDDRAFENSFMGRVAPLEESEFGGGGGGSGGGPDAEADEASVQKAQLPQPVDLTIPPGKASVILTGPNTGGSAAHSVLLCNLAGPSSEYAAHPCMAGPVTWQGLSACRLQQQKGSSKADRKALCSHW